MSDDIQKETERIHQGIVESLSFSDALAKRDAEIERLRDKVCLLTEQAASYSADIERLRSLLRESIRVPQQLNAGAVSPVAWRKDYARRVREALGDD